MAPTDETAPRRGGMKREEFEALLDEYFGIAESDHRATILEAEDAEKKASEVRAAILTEFDRLKDCERVAWCLTRGVDQRDRRMGRKEGNRTWMVDIGAPGANDSYTDRGRRRFVHINADGQQDMDVPVPGFNIAESPDPARVRAIIDREMEADHGNQ